MVRHQRGSISVPAPAERPTSAQAVGHGGPGPPPLPVLPVCHAGQSPPAPGTIPGPRVPIPPPSLLHFVQSRGLPCSRAVPVPTPWCRASAWHRRGAAGRKMAFWREQREEKKQEDLVAREMDCFNLLRNGPEIRTDKRAQPDKKWCVKATSFSTS